jgi:uncharacterized membrane protein
VRATSRNAINEHGGFVIALERTSKGKGMSFFLKWSHTHTRLCTQTSALARRLQCNFCYFELHLEFYYSLNQDSSWFYF